MTGVLARGRGPATWLALWAGWTVATRGFHPDLRLAILATGVLVGASALAVWADASRLVPRFLARGRRLAYALGLAAAVLAIGAAAALVIHLVYDLLLGPDPRRFGLPTNIALDAAFVGLHVGLAWTLRVALRVRARLHR